MYKEIWNEIKEQVLNTLPNAKKIWLQNIEFLSEENNKITLVAMSSLNVQNFKKYCFDVIKNAFEALTETCVELIIVAENEEGITVSVEKEKVKTTPVTKLASSKGKEKSSFNEKYTFDSFISGSNSDFAFTAAQTVARDPGPTYNPFLIYGGVGLGKTHLLQSIGNYVEQNDPGKKVIYVTIEEFLNEFLSVYKNSDANNKFKIKYRNADILLIDDLQFLENKEATQTELFHIFNALYENDKQIVFTSDRPITELVGISDRLLSRFGKGLSVDLMPPPYEVRLAILNKKCEEANIKMSNEVLSYIANSVNSNVRDLEGVLTSLGAYSKLLNQEITIKMAEQKIRDIIPSPIFSKQDITINDIIYEVSSYYNIEVVDIKGASRKKSIKDARNIAIYLSTKLTAYSASEIGAVFNRDHSTVSHAKSEITKYRKSDSTLASALDTIEQKIRQKLS